MIDKIIRSFMMHINFVKLQILYNSLVEINEIYKLIILYITNYKTIK